MNRFKLGRWLQITVVAFGLALCFCVAAATSEGTVHVLEQLNYYELLEVDSTCSSSQLKSQYRKRSLLLHPDKNSDPNAPALFQQLSKAYETLKDPTSRTLYNTHGNTWEFIKEYKEKLVTFERQMFRRGHQMYMQNVKVAIDEPFLNEKNVQIIHHSFAPQLLGGYNGVWVIFIGNPNCGPCRSLAPRIKEFARSMSNSRKDRLDPSDPTSRKWLRVGAINMAVSDNHYLVESFGSAAQSLPQIVLLAPNTTAPDFSDFEIVPGSDWRELSSPELSDYLYTTARRLLSRAVPLLPTEGIKDTSIASMMAAMVSKLKKPGANKSSALAALAVHNGSKCEECAELRSVFRRMASKFHGSGIEFSLLDCFRSEHKGTKACSAIQEFPKLFVHPGTQGGGVSTLDIGEGFYSQDIQKYGYSPFQMSFSVLLGAVRDIQTGQDDGVVPHYPRILHASAVPKAVSFLKGQYSFVGMTNGKPYWKHARYDAFLRWLPAKYRGGDVGAWILGDVMDSIDQGWGFLEEDIYIPVRPLTCWNIINGGRFKRDKDFEFMVPAGDEYKKTLKKTRPLPIPITHDEL